MRVKDFFKNLFLGNKLINYSPELLMSVNSFQQITFHKSLLHTAFKFYQEWNHVIFFELLQ